MHNVELERFIDMKIIQLINSLQRGGGAEKFLLDLLLAQNQINGTEVILINLMPPLNNDFNEICISNGIKIYNIGSTKYSIRGIMSLKKIIDLEKPDVVHVHLFPSLYYASIIKRLSKYSYKLIYTEHSTSNRRRKIPFLKLLDRFFYNKYDKIIAISNQVLDGLTSYLPKLDAVIINNGIDIIAIHSAAKLDLRNYLNIPNNCFILSMVARFCDIKDYDTVIKAISKLPINVHFVCVGNGPTLDSTRQLSKELNVETRVHFLGLRKDVYSILKGSDAIVLSTHHEGFSISMLEAMACSKPFIGSSVPGINDLVYNVAALFEYKNDEQLANLIIKISTDKDYYNKLSYNSFEFAKKYDIKSIAKKYIQEYKN